MTLINPIKKLRVNKEMTQAQLAKECGVSQVTIAQWEKGTGFPKTEKISAVAKALDCDVTVLLQMAEDRQTNRIAGRG